MNIFKKYSTVLAAWFLLVLALAVLWSATNLARVAALGLALLAIVIILFVTPRRNLSINGHH
jgi:hypothetical protein